MNCLRCGKLATFVPQYQRWFCETCKEYVPAPAAAPPPKGPNLGLAIGLPLGIVGGLVVLAILAAVAIPSFLSYQKKAKTSEAEINLEQLFRAVRAYHVDKDQLPERNAGPTPALGDCCASGGKCAPSLSQWTEDPTWSDLGFSVDTPHYFSYRYENTGSSFTLQAIGDLDCDESYVTYTQMGTVDLTSGRVEKMGPLLSPPRPD